MRRLFACLLLALILAGPGRAQGAGDARPDYYFLQDPADLAPGGGLRGPGERIPVFFVHGFLKDDVVVDPKIHVVFSFLHSQFIKKVNRGQSPFEHVYPVHYRYAPTKSYRDLGRDFAARVNERYGEIPCILFVHSAGALMARFAAEAGLPVAAVVGLSPAHGGSPGATLMYANDKILADGRVEKDHFEVIQRTLAEIGVPDPVARSLAWDNADGVLAAADIARYGLVVQPKLPDFRYDRFDHYGILERFVAPFASFDFLGTQTKSNHKKSDRELEWELLGRYSPRWKESDGVVVPYPKTPADGKTKIWTRTYTGIGHREIFIDRDVLDRGWDQVTRTARVLLGVEPESPPEAVDPPTPVASTTPPATPPPTSLVGTPGDLGDVDLGGLDDLDDDLGGEDLDGPAPTPAATPAPVPRPTLVAAVPVAPPRDPVPDVLAGVDLERVEARGTVPSWEDRPALRLGGDLFGALDPERMVRWERR